MSRSCVSLSPTRDTLAASCANRSGGICTNFDARSGSSTCTERVLLLKHAQKRMHSERGASPPDPVRSLKRRLRIKQVTGKEMLFLLPSKHCYGVSVVSKARRKGRRRGVKPPAMLQDHKRLLQHCFRSLFLSAPVELPNFLQAPPPACPASGWRSAARACDQLNDLRLTCLEHGKQQHEHRATLPMQDDRA